jgi:opacity protein-like surface antigen
MKTKSLLLASAMLTALPSLAYAEPTDSWYMGIGAGANWLDAEGEATIVPPGSTTAADVDFDTGWVVLGGVGYHWDGFRLELELGYRDNDFESITTLGGTFPGS